MAVSGFDHFNILTPDIDAARTFFESVLGLEVGPRPPFRSPGFWMYLGDQAVVHISDAAHHEQTHVEDIGRVETSGKHGVVDHIAFRCSGYQETKARLSELGVASHEADVPALANRQVFVDGPNGLTLELIFTPADAASELVRAVGELA